MRAFNLKFLNIPLFFENQAVIELEPVVAFGFETTLQVQKILNSI